VSYSSSRCHHRLSDTHSIIVRNTSHVVLPNYATVDVDEAPVVICSHRNRNTVDHSTITLFLNIPTAMALVLCFEVQKQ